MHELTFEWIVLLPQNHSDVFYAMFRKTWGVGDCAHWKSHLNTVINKNIIKGLIRQFGDNVVEPQFVAQMTQAGWGFISFFNAIG